MDAEIIRDCLWKIFDGNIRFNFIRADMDAYFGLDHISDPPPNIEEFGETAIFVERVFYRPYLDNYKTRILIPNPEWIDENTKTVTHEIIDIIMHKTRHSLNVLQPVFPQKEHRYVGFTSLDPCQAVRGYAGFSHFRGKSLKRHTDDILSIWQEKSDLPQLNMQLYGDDVGFKYNGWLEGDNIRIHPSYFHSNAEYFDALAQHGMHLCTSEVEGFGHYLNESRAMSAAIIALDAPPMNELVSEGDGILVPVSHAEPMVFGVRYRADQAAIEHAIDRMLSLNENQRADLGKAARHRFELERQAFEDALRDYVNEAMV
jgi:hypothetical protein